MEKQKSLFQNAIFNFIKTFSSVAFPVITFSYASRILGEEGIGQVNFAKSIVLWFTMFALLGMNYYGTREAAKLREDRDKLSKFTHEMLFINGTATVLAYILLLLLMAFVPRLSAYKTLLLLSSLAIVLQGMGMEWLYRALEEYRYIAVRSILFQLGALVVLFVFVRDVGDIVPYAAVSLIATYGTYVLNFINVRKFIDLRWYGHYEIRKHLRPLLWLSAMTVSIELYTVLDTTMLGFLQEDASVGRYTAAVRVNKLVISLITAIGAVLVPRLSYYISHNAQGNVKTLVHKAYNYVFLLSVPASVGLYMLSQEIIQLFSGPKFASAVLTMRIMTPIVLIIPFNATTTDQILVSLGKETLILRATLTGAVTNFIFNAMLIPRYAENGAAVATVAAESAVAIVCFFNARKFFDMKQIFRSYYQYWLGVLPIPLLAVWIKAWPVHYVVGMFLTIVLSAGCYFLILFCLKNKYLLEAIQTVSGKR